MADMWNLEGTRTPNIAGTLRCTLSRFAGDESGATAIEYAMIAAGVGATIASTVFTLGGTVSDMLFDRVVDGMGG